MMRKGEVHTAPVTGVLASSLAVGSTVKLMEGGTAVEYLVVNQGIPGNSSLYDASCDGTWLLRKDIHSTTAWNTSNVNKYESSAINTRLNGDFFNTLGSVEQSAIREIKIPYCVGNGSLTINGGANGLSTKIFLLSGCEIGIGGVTYVPQDGAKLDYFSQTIGTDSKRIAYLNGAALNWWLRSQNTSTTVAVMCVTTKGGYDGFGARSTLGVRPALVLPSNAVFDETTKLLKGVK